MERPNVPAVAVVEGLSESLSGKPEWKRPRERQHTSVCNCVGRREGWRNNLDGLGLIRERETDRHKDIRTHSKISSCGSGRPTLTQNPILMVYLRA